MEFDGLVEAGTFAEMTEIPEGCNVVGYFETFAPTPSATSNRLVAAMACKLDWDLMHLDVDQAFIQPESDTDIFLRLPPVVDQYLAR